jgi:lysophospholipase L1-like esterase
MKLGGILALTAALVLTGCAPAAPPVSEKVQKYYDESLTQKPTHTKVPPIVAFLGDSYTAGAGTTQGSKRWTTLLSQSLGWVETNIGRGGTGYLTTSGKDGCGLDVCPNYVGMIPDAVKAKPSIVVVSGGRNDLSKDPQTVAANVHEFFTTLRADLPDAKIIATSPAWDATTPPERLAALAIVIQTEAQSVKATYVDLGQPLAGKPDLISADKVHPNDAGHSALYLAAKDAMNRAGVLD